MLGLDKAGADKLLLQIEEKGFIDSRYLFFKSNNELCLLGSGAFSYVYEMYDSLAPERHYAAKVIGLGSKAVDQEIIVQTTQIQYFLGEQSENILRVIALWTMKLHMGENGDVQGITGINEEGFAEAEGIPVQIVLMEKLDNIFSKDKYGNIELLREDLKTEAGVVKFAENIGRALFTVHNNSFLHRDIKLENIFWDHDLQQYKLGDFGIARYVEDGEADTVVFTDGYGAPEIERQLACSYNAAADIYSFGITLYLLLNDFKFPASDGYHASIAQYTKDFVVPAPAAASENMSRIIRKMCSYRVEDRYQSVEEILMDLGRLDGSYTDQGFTEYDDMPTETFRVDGGSVPEPHGEPAGEEAEESAETEGTKEIKEVPWWEKEYCDLNREERKKRAQIYNQMYAESSVWRLCISAVLFALLFKAFSPEATYVNAWQFWILPIALFAESILERVKEFYIESEIITIGLAFYSAYSLGVDLPVVTVIAAAALGIPAITAGCAVGTGLWIALVSTGRLAWLSFLDRWDLGWIVLLGLAAVVDGYVMLRADYNRLTRRDTVWMWIIDKLWYILILGGIILLLLEKFDVITIPEILGRLHLVRTGIGMFVIEIFYLKYYGILDNDDDCGEEKNDESLDE